MHLCKNNCHIIRNKCVNLRAPTQVMKSIDFVKHSDGIPSQKGYGDSVTYAYSQAILQLFSKLLGQTALKAII